MIFSAAFSPDGKRIVIASLAATARIWDAATGKPIGEPLRGHEDAVISAAFSPDGRRIVTASQDKTARLWDAATGRPVGESLKGHEGAVISAAFRPDGGRIVTASEDKTARVWDAASGQPIGEPLKHEDAVNRAAFSPDGRRIVTASDWAARLWDAASGKPIGEPLNDHEESCIARRSALTAGASSPHLKTRRHESGTPRQEADRGAAHRPCGCCSERGVQPRRSTHRHRVLGQDGARLGCRDRQSRSASRSEAMRMRSSAWRSAPTASASSPRLETRRRASGTPRPASRSGAA